ncbi:MAG: TonB-dependent receptor [Saprospiraceae bacterium]|nr:TonB-dependent receptor [Saprospiraceae bacterium]
MVKFLLFACLIGCSSVVFGQNLTQTVRGTVLDDDSKTPLIGASVRIADIEPVIGATTDSEGSFRLSGVPVGRITLHISYLGYESASIPNIVVNSGKEVVLQLSLQESALKMSEVVITVDKNKGEAINDMALIGTRSISPEQTNRYAGGFNDPSRILSNFAGITATQDGSNDIIVRGNAPKYVQWRLEGEQITNPNHFADQSSVGGSVSTLNNNLLAASDFHTGAFQAEFGDVLSGVYDVRLRAGNNEKLEAVFGFGLLGTELTLEGPFKKGYGGSFLVNYRYSTATILKETGLMDISGVPKFQDATFKLVLPTRKAGVFSLYGLGGWSSFEFDDVTPAIWELPGDRFMRADIEEDFRKKAHLGNLGLNHHLGLNDRSYVKTTLSYANEGIDDRVFEEGILKIYDDEGEFIRDSTLSRTLNFTGKIAKNTWRASTTYHYKWNARHKIQIGTKYALQDYRFKQSRYENTPDVRTTLVDFNENVATLRNFISWKYRPSSQISMVAGLHNMNVLLNRKSTLEPRLAFQWKPDGSNTFNAGYGLHSNMEAIHHYFAKQTLPDGRQIEPNRDLDLLKAHHFVLGYEKRLNENLSAKLEVYYQSLYDIPVENNDTSYFSTLNEGLDFRYVELVNEGTGKNYGLEITLERYFSRNWYALVNMSLYQSKYKSLEGIERNTQYNGNYLVNVLAGKEFVRLGKRNNQTLGINAKAFFGGGRKIIPLLRDANGNLAVDPANNRYFDYERAYESSIEDLYLIVASVSYKWQKRRATHELFLNLDNVTNNKGRLTEFYDENEPGKIGYMRQFGLFPNLLYRVYF